MPWRNSTLLLHAKHIKNVSHIYIWHTYIPHPDKICYHLKLTESLTHRNSLTHFLMRKNYGLFLLLSWTNFFYLSNSLKVKLFQIVVYPGLLFPGGRGWNGYALTSFVPSLLHCFCTFFVVYIPIFPWIRPCT